MRHHTLSIDNHHVNIMKDNFQFKAEFTFTENL